jgi:UDP-N-acetylglucosamine--N-acetylmuramyl-(pentapeptide) pyrophosphoryl-undecaprenol N-acetylglucosamine transferase
MARIGIACGGTGGHLFPGLAVAERLRAAGHEVRLYVSAKDIDRQALQPYPEYKSLALPVIGWPGLGLKTPQFFLCFLKAYQMATAELRDYRPEAILGMGGFTCAPMLLSARVRRIPTLLHESNAIPGKVTRWLAPRMSAVLLGFSECAAHVEATSLKITGTPVRTSLRRVDRSAAAAHWGLDSDPQVMTLAVMGGSQGASGLNRMLNRAAAEWSALADRMQIIHLAGPKDVELLELNYRRAGIKAVVRSFCDSMEMVYSMADLAVARSGAASLTELAFYGIPSVLVPYPFAAEDHQTRNAEVFHKKGAALLVSESDEGAVILAREVRELWLNRERRANMAEHTRQLDVPDAAETVAKEVERVCF